MKELDSKTTLLWAIASTTLFMVFAHLYRWVNSLMASHDSLFFDQSGYFTRNIGLGRFLQPVYTEVRGDANAPFLIGLLSIVFVALSVFFVVRLLDMRKPILVFLTSAVMSTNAAVVLLSATYIGWLDIFMLALLVSVLAVWCWAKFSCRVGSILCVMCVFISLGLYQAFLQVCITLLFLYLIRTILSEGKIERKIVVSSLRFLLCVLIAGVLYYLCAKLVWNITGIPASSGYNGLAGIGDYSEYSLHSIWNLFSDAYFLPFQLLVSPDTYFSALAGGINVLLLLGSFVGVVYIIERTHLKSSAIFLIIILIAALPIAMNFTYLISKGMVHGLMIYSYYFFYVFVLMVADLASSICKEAKPALKAKSDFRRLQLFAGCAVISMLVICFSNIIFSNDAYLKKELEAYSTYSTMTRVVDRVEQQPGYEPGVTEVAYVGALNDSAYLNIDRSFAIPRFAHSPAWDAANLVRETGLAYNSPITYQDSMINYFKYILGCNMKIADEAVEEDLQKKSDVLEMPAFPEDGCCEYVDGVLVMKLS